MSSSCAFVYAYFFGRLYKANSSQCMPCHEECESVCTGPGAEHCKICKHVRDGNVCAPECPSGKYNDSGECKPCHSNCVNGCYGPENTVSSNGCVSCEKAIINGNVVVSCAANWPKKSKSLNGFLTL